MYVTTFKYHNRQVRRKEKSTYRINWKPYDIFDEGQKSGGVKDGDVAGREAYLTHAWRN